MSNYTKITKHPNKPIWQAAEYKDDYFGPHLYGVKFPHDDVVYPVSMVDEGDIKEFWAKDVMKAVEKQHGPSGLMEFLDLLQEEYQARWERDPIEGEGAIQHYTEKIKNERASTRTGNPRTTA